jgi:hypothetical protein
VALVERAFPRPRDEAVVIKENREVRLLSRALYLDAASSKRKSTARRHTCPTSGLAHHGLASEARSTGVKPLALSPFRPFARSIAIPPCTLHEFAT